MEAANAIPKGTLGTSGAGVRKGPDNELSLIDFDGPEQASSSAAQQDLTASDAPAPPPKAGNALEDDLLGLNMGDGNFGEGGGISLGSSSNGTSSKAPAMGTADIMAQFSQPQSQRATPQPSTPATFSQPPQPQSASTDLFGPISGSQTATPPQQQQQPQKKADPFAALAGSRSGTPSQFQKPLSPPGPSSSGLDLLGGAPATSSAAAPSTAGDDEWTFSSALPDQPKDLVVTNSSIRTVFAVTRPNNTELNIDSRISNATAQPIEDLTFQLAVTKVKQCP